MTRRHGYPTFRTLPQLPWSIGIVIAGLIYVSLRLLLVGYPAGGRFLAVLANLLRTNVGFVLLVLSLGAFPGLIKAFRSRMKSRRVDLTAIRALPWSDFQTLCAEAYSRLGYSAQKNINRGATHNIDLILHKGGAVSFVLCHRWRSPRVDVKEIRELHDAVVAGNADRGIFVTSGAYTGTAALFARNKPLELMDGPALALLLSEVQQRGGQEAQGSRAESSSDPPNSALPSLSPASHILPNGKFSLTPGTIDKSELDDFPFGNCPHSPRFGGSAKMG